ncbi:MAG TPA: AI-2E family transporter [Mobilitalea sp.]|nr:AI-2E family transporter [Mobilitalea sp.]
MDIIIDYMKRPFVKRIFVLLIICLLLFFIRSQMTLLLLTFIFVFLVDSMQKSISRLLYNKFHINTKAIIVALYLILVGLFFLVIYIYVPKVIEQVTDIVDYVTNFLLDIKTEIKTDNAILLYIYDYLQKIDINNYLKNNATAIISVISNIGSIGINIIMAVILSMFFLLEKDKTRNFIHGFQHSKISWIYEELKYFGNKFTNSFGKVIQTQILISCINSIISTIILTCLRFPNTMGLFILIFVLGMIPVAGVVISLIPLSIIAYSVGGTNYVIYVIILIIFLHALESYILNPKLLSHRTKLPVFVTFLILIISEHLMGIWGLIVGIPITIFIMDILEVKIGD